MLKHFFLITTIIAPLLVVSSAKATESCEEGCSIATESGVSLFTRENGQELKCCCIQSVTSGQMESKPLEECPES